MNFKYNLTKKHGWNNSLAAARDVKSRRFLIIVAIVGKKEGIYDLASFRSSIYPAFAESSFSFISGVIRVCDRGDDYCGPRSVTNVGFSTREEIPRGCCSIKTNSTAEIQLTSARCHIALRHSASIFNRNKNKQNELSLEWIV